MEGFFSLVLIVLAYVFIPKIIGLIFGGTATALKAGVQTIKGKGSFAENFSSEWKGMGPLEMRATIVEDALEDGTPFKQIKCEIRGLLPNQHKTRMSSVLSLFARDNDGELGVITSALDEWQEPNSPVYQHLQNMGEMDTNLGFKDWVTVGVAFIPTLTAAWSGRREVVCVLRLMDGNINDEILFGHPEDESAVLGSYTATVEVDFEGHGYTESAEKNAAIKPLAVKLAVAVAAADGDFAHAEGDVIKNWIQRQLTMVTESRKESVKAACNQALKETFHLATSGDLSISSITNEINDLAGDPDKYEIIELCMEVMAADGEADQSEMDLIWRIAKSLGLERAEVEKIKDKKVLALNIAGNVEKDSVNDLLGIDPSWSDSEKKEFLKREFKKWNSRLHSVSSDDEKANVQRMLDAISEARKQLG